ncbi:MAG: spore cortex biosynthesis protein YabQ [Bacillota bacterium]|jgi:spore cortex biosynthesis protein YabQ|nr:spore cortex biosynthesis protein YabQ [Bacillota bacterium]NLV62324.1 spore cortex biosynthesis protein YabQ [Clostridiaceae bacterium]
MIHEVYVFLSAMASGLTAGFLYDIIRMKRKALKTKMAMAAFEDIAFWIITSILIFVTAYVSNQGEIRMYFFLAVLIGVVFYYAFMSRWVILILTFILKITLKPFILLFRLLKPLYNLIFKFIADKAEKTGNKLHIAKIKANRRLKSLRHIFKKV